MEIERGANWFLGMAILEDKRVPTHNKRMTMTRITCGVMPSCQSEKRDNLLPQLWTDCFELGNVENGALFYPYF